MSRPLPLLLLTLTVVAAAVSTDKTLCDVTDFGAVGDGHTNDTAAFAQAFAACGALDTGGTVYLPTGLYLITSTLKFDASAGPIDLVGDGWTSNVLWAFDDDLFVWQAPQEVAWITVRDLAVTSTTQAKSPTSTALSFPSGFSQSLVDHVIFYGSGDVPGTSIQSQVFGSGIDMGTISDTSTVRDCVMWFLQGTGVLIGKGSEIRIEGGRIIGNGMTGTGVHVTGNNGGVHIAGTDVISLHTGVLLNNSNGAGSNREIFITHATLDSNFRGLAVYDDSYVSIAGMWAASSDGDNVWVSPGATNCMLDITGGTIFNAGALTSSCSDNVCNGLTVNAGSFSLTGVAVRNNKGRGIWVNNAAVKSYSITGCRIYSNGVGVDLNGTDYLLSSNVFFSNAAPNVFRSQAGALITNNVGITSNATRQL